MEGDEERFRQLHAAMYADLLRFVERRVPPAEAEDVVATVFLVAWRRWADVPEDARPWLFGVARKTIANQNRGLRRHGAVDLRMVEDVPAAADAAPDRIDLVRAWWTLSAADREVLALVAFDGLTGDEAATVLGCRRSAFTMRLGRARQRLRRALEPVHPGDTIGKQTWITT
ncbi:sigma-70 family RNA polymerase sigma factor [Actinoplanes sp. NPDC049596]|uniref:RNA polymerase sigma factor n=1 Tax=unclassified Actinoplanes TaxID=2626549 RepID=UPI00341D197F